MFVCGHDIDLADVLLEVINNFGLLTQLSDVHQTFGEFTPPSIDDLIAHNHLPP